MEYAQTTRQPARILRQTDRTKKPRGTRTQKRTACVHRPAFLKQVFRPLISNLHEELENVAEIERNFYLSMKNLCDSYSFEMETHQDLPYPMNLGRCISELKYRLSSIDKNLELRLVNDEMSCARLATVRAFSTGTTLFYLPVAPLFHLLENLKTKKTGELLLSVFSYLFRYIGIPHYAEDYSYLGGIYEMIEEWNREEDNPDRDEQYYEFIASHFEMIWEKGKVCIMLMNEKKNLTEWKQRVEAFRAKTTVEQELLQTAKNFLNLFEEFPTRNIHDRLEIPNPDDDYEGVIRLEQYLHFFWDYDEPIHQEFMDSINAELNECNLIEEPVTYQFFNIPQSIGGDCHEFEKRLCDLLHELTDNLTDLMK